MPFKSEAQRKFMNAAASRGDIKQSTVNEFNEASKGMHLPPKLPIDHPAHPMHPQHHEYMASHMQPTPAEGSPEEEASEPSSEAKAEGDMSQHQGGKAGHIANSLASLMSKRSPKKK